MTDGTAAETFGVSGGRALVGSVRAPGDKSISHRALLLAALADGASTITGLSDGDDVRRTLEAVRAVGAEVEESAASVGVRGGRSRLHAPGGPIDLGNSGTGMRLLLGLLAGLPVTAQLTGDDSLRSRPMDRVAQPLGLMGAEVTGQGPRCLPPVTITGGALHGIEYTPPMASAQVKSALLLAGLAADGDTVVHEPVPTRAHTEELLAQMGADIAVSTSAAGRTITVRRSPLHPTVVVVPGDPSQAAFWVVGGLVVPRSVVSVEGTYLGAERTGFINVLQRMGGQVTVDAQGAGHGSVTARSSALTGTVIHAEEIPSLDEVPILAVAAAVASGESRFVDVGELRVKESDRLGGTVDLVTAFGGTAHIDGDDLVISGSGRLHPAAIDARGDHRMAMAAAIAGAACPSATDLTTISGWETVQSSYPRFAEDLETLSVAG
ncbi:MAG TPA: 3-phosphoshikimate 1-carboxyvinyltransferase [Acidimicrobiales bacterium]|nr:3-phosphoshikimate 1-carboxyvinyltransferase [Acidimicrobiales bacterium]